MLIRKSTSYLLAFFALLFTQAVFAATGDVLSSFSISNISGDGRTPSTPQGITYHDGKLYIVDFGTDRIYRTYPEDVLDTDDITVLFTAGESDFNIPLTDSGTDGPTGGGLTFANTFLWSSSPITDQIIKLDPVDGGNLESENTLSTVAFPSPSGITFDGTYFWIVDWQSNTINKVLAEDGTVLSSIPGPSTLPSFDTDPNVTNARPFGITWDGVALWVSDHEDDMIYRVNPDDGAILTYFSTASFAIPSDDPKGLAWDGEFLWLTDNKSQTIYKIDSGVIPLGIIGCIEKNGKAVAGDVLLSQTAEADQSTTTDTDGCFTFASFVSGVPVSVGVSESGLDEKPIITLTQVGGSNDVTLTVGDTYSEPGATASDTEDGDITSSIIAAPDVINSPLLIDTSTTSPVEGYTVTYNVVDSAGNLADQQTRTIFVVAVDIEAPVITLIGDDPMNVEQASTYTEPGATASDTRDGDLSSSIVVSGTVDTNTTGAYTISYDVSDLTGNPATTVTRTINIADTTIPIITLIGSDPVTLEKGDTYTDTGASATDNIDGDISGSISVSGSVTQDIVGSYVLTYNVSDLSGNAATTVTRTVNVVDTTIPVITLIGSTPYNQELNTTFTDPGATASDAPGEDLTASIIVSGSVNTAIAGTYTLTYDITDTASNAAISVTRDVVIADTGAPAITLLGDNPFSQELGLSFTEPGATATDAVDGDLTASIVIAGDIVDPNTIGTYNITYNVVDSVSNSAPTQTRTVTVADTTPPLITLTGSANILHELNTPFTDEGATASDNTDGDISAGIVVGGDAVNTSLAGVYSITYNINDAAGNPAAPMTRVVDVADRTAPTLILTGSNPINHEVGTVFVDPGATASDIIDGNISANIGIIGSVDANTVGSYTLTYNISDAAGNAATTLIRSINVVDTGIPTISLIGSNPINHELNTAFTDPGATANDAADGDLTGSIVTTGSVNANAAATYTLTYNVSDSQSNAATTVTRDVIVADTTAPVITLTGSSIVNVEQGDTYTDAGATALDTIDGDLTATISLGGSVNTSIRGTYTLTYNISDTVGNAATQVSRTINVIDTTIPVITLSGANPLNHEVGTIFTDPGATANDNIDGSLTSSIGVSGSVNAGAVGTYILSYNVADSAGNSATTLTRTVNVADTGAPLITVTGANPVNHEINTSYTDLGATASDVVDGDLTSSINVGGDTVNTAIIGTYTITYNVSDSNSNAAPQQTRTVNVNDFTAPVITLIGGSTVNLELGSSYTELGANATDNLDGDISASIATSGSVDTLNSGSYVISYNVNDTAGNTATQIERTVIVSDTTLPVISLLGSSPLNHEQGTVYSDAGASATDNTDGNITSNIVTSGVVDANAANTYTLNYNVSDAAGNNATTVTRTVIVSDSTIPTLSLIGSSLIIHEQGSVYNDSGATGSDNIDGDISASIIVTGTVDTNTAGSYTLTYNVVDSTGNAANAITRTINVTDTTAPVITLIGSASINHEQGTAYTDSGSTGFDSVDGDISGNVAVTGSVNINVAGTYTLSYNVSDFAGNTATTITRDIIVADTIIPALALIGSSIVNHEQAAIYTDAGATATDNFDGDISVNVLTTGSVNVNLPGTYTLSYNVNDAAGNAATTITRDVVIADTTAPVITLTGSATVNVEQGTSYSDAGATASDNVDGNITGNIIISGDTVNPNTAGTYIIRYDISDAATNTAIQVTRTVIVADTTIPVLSIIGDNPLAHEQGDTYTDLGATANDTVDGDISINIVATGSVDSNTTGSYIVTYDVTDSSGNAAASVSRTINVTDTTAPVITLLGSSLVDHEQGTAYTDTGTTAFDSIDGDVSGNVIMTGSVNVNIANTYTLSYNVSDLAGNAATTVTRDVIIADTIAPVITLTGSTTVNIEQGASYSDAGATASDNVDGNVTASINISGDIVDPNTAGSYIIRYDVSDIATNAATQVTRTVIVTDSTIPVITLLGATPTSHEQGTAYMDLGATAADNISGDISANVVVTGTIDVNTASTYILTYNVSDGAGNAAVPVTRDVIVTDTTPPIITLINGAIVSHEQGTPYSDAGATAADTIDGDVTASIVVTGTVDINTAGSYILSYNVSDTATNAATTITRTVNISDTTIPVISLQGDATVDSIQGQLFTDPGTSALDNIDGDISASVVTSGTIDINTEGTYILNYDVVDGSGNNATTVNRTVNIVSPVIISIEAETATIGGAHAVASTNAGFTGSGYIEHSGEGYIEYTFTAYSVPYDLTVRYALDTGDKPLEVILNSSSLGNLSFPSTGSFTTWGNTATFSFTPLSGSNTIRLQTTGASGANVDQLTLTPQ